MKFSRQPLHRGDYIGFAAFGAVVLGSFSSIAFRSRVGGEPSELALTFILGGLFLLFGITTRHLVEDGNVRQGLVYFLVQAGLCLGCIWISPVRGFFGILGLPLASQCVFLFRWRGALFGSVLLYLGTCMVFFPANGWQGVFEAMLSYSTAYIFTVGFSFVTVDAVRGRLTAAALTEDLEKANTQLRAHAAQAEELATTRERNRLAREIHDGVGHYLTVINIQLEAARAVFDKDPAKARQAVEKATRLSKDALDDVRRSVGTLRTDDSRPALPAALNQLVSDAGIPVNFTVAGESRRLSSAIEHALYRAAQEGLTNVRKHAQATQTQLRLDFRNPSNVSLSVIDDGQGLTPKDAAPGYGLKGMHERIELLGGKVSANARNPGGFELIVEVPV